VQCVVQFFSAEQMPGVEREQADWHLPVAELRIHKTAPKEMTGDVKTSGCCGS